MTRKQVEGQIFENLPFDVFALLLPTRKLSFRAIWTKFLRAHFREKREFIFVFLDIQTGVYCFYVVCLSMNTVKVIFKIVS